MADCLSNAVVVRLILQHFSNPELLKLSFVNKQWNYEARSVMKHRGNLTALLKFYDSQPCQEYLEAFAADLIRMNVVPFSGIKIQLLHCSGPCPIRALHSTYNTILDQLPLKRISSIYLAGEWSKKTDCPGLVLVEAIMEQFGDVLEEVSLAKYSPKPKNLVVGFVKNCSFPNLKILKLTDNFEGSEGAHLISLLKPMVTRAPKLQELHTPGPMNLMLNVLEGTSAVFVDQSDVWAPFDEIPDNCMSAIRLEKIRLHYYNGPDFNVERFNRVTPMLLQVSCTATLHSIDLDAFLAMPLMCYGIRFENVKSLTMKINFSQLERLEPRILRIVMNFDFTRMFPNLGNVKIFAPDDNPEYSVDHINAFVEQANASLKEPEPDRAINIRNLDLSTGISHHNAGFYAEMFPHIETLQVTEKHEGISFVSIWENWAKLKDLQVFAQINNHSSLDSVICGIFPEEVAELREKDEDFLKKVNIVPVMPAITCLRNVQKLFLLLSPFSDGLYDLHAEPSPHVTLSKVTGLIAFRRCPNLAVKLLTCVPHVHESLLHMKPYVSVYI